MTDHTTKLRDILFDKPLPRDRKRLLDAARVDASDAAERLVLGGHDGDMVCLVLGRDGRVHIKEYGRTR